MPCPFLVETNETITSPHFQLDPVTFVEWDVTSDMISNNGMTYYICVLCPNVCQTITRREREVVVVGEKIKGEIPPRAFDDLKNILGFLAALSQLFDCWTNNQPATHFVFSRVDNKYPDWNIQHSNLWLPLTSMMYRAEILEVHLYISPQNVLKYRTQSAGQLWLMCYCDVRYKTRWQMGGHHGHIFTTLVPQKFCRHVSSSFSPLHPSL